MNAMLVLLNVGLAGLNGAMAYHNYSIGHYLPVAMNMFACGFCAAMGCAIAINAALR
jgi:hypothetical protein